MKRTKAWWVQLSAEERTELVYLERNQGTSSCSYLPDDCGECHSCGQPAFCGHCGSCADRLEALITKANGEKHEVQSLQ